MEDNKKYSEQDVIRLMEEMADAAPDIPAGLEDEMLENIKKRKKAMDARADRDQSGGMPEASVQQSPAAAQQTDENNTAKAGGKLLPFRGRRVAAILSAAAAFVLVLGGILYSRGSLFGTGGSAFIKSDPFIPEVSARAETTADPDAGADPFSFPFTAAAYIEITGECGCVWNHGGFMISEDKLVSSPDCLICPEHGSAAAAAEFFFGFLNRRNCFLDYDGEWEVLTGEKDDFCCIRLAGKAGETTGWFGTLWNMPDSDAASGSWQVCGYTEDGLKASGAALEAESGALLRYRSDTDPGPGYPVYSSDNYVLGVTVSGKKGDTLVRRLDEDIRKVTGIK